MSLVQTRSPVVGLILACVASALALCTGCDAEQETHERSAAKASSEGGAGGAGGGADTTEAGDTTSGGGAGEGRSGGGEPCITCLGVLSGESGTLCPGSEALYQQLGHCACDGACAWACDTACDGAASSLCDECIFDTTSGCGWELDQCKSDL